MRNPSPIHIRVSLLVVLTTACSIAHCAESQYPLWDNHESIADYAKRVNLPPTKTLELGDNVKLVAWYGGNSKNTSHPAGQKEANVFGLYDMHGNVWQWCQDWFDSDYYSKSPVENPQGPDHGASRLLRGGSWGDIPLACRSAFRFRCGMGQRYYIFGFRVVVVPAFRTP